MKKYSLTVALSLALIAACGFIIVNAQPASRYPQEVLDRAKVEEARREMEETLQKQRAEELTEQQRDEAAAAKAKPEAEQRAQQEQDEPRMGPGTSEP